MARSHPNPRTLATLILLGAMVIVFTLAGNWQLRRAAERRATSHAIESGRNQAPLHLNANSPHSGFVNWRPVTASGTWRNDLTILLENRRFKGYIGYWVATPLLLDAASNTAVMVLRGWVHRPLGPKDKMAPIPNPQGLQTINGQLISRVPRLFEIWSLEHSTAGKLPAQLPLANHPLPHVQNLDLKAYAQATGLTLLPTIIEQTSDSQDGFGREWPHASLNASENIGYAMQWFAFASIAGIAWLVTALNALRRRNQANRPPPAQA
ncbi:MAG: SURF1 family protein [Paralcaligenes sp.]